jgi:uncharacterized protein (UPF0297 family)
MDEMNHTRGEGKILPLGNVVRCPNAMPAAPARDESETDGKQALDELVRIMQGEGMNPVVQLSGYFVTEDPTYLPAEHHARGLARRVGRDKLLQALIEQYVSTHDPANTGDKD